MLLQPVVHPLLQKHHFIRRYWRLAPTKHCSLLSSVPAQRLHLPHRFLYNPSIVSVLLKTWSIVQVDKKRHDRSDSRCWGRMRAIEWQRAQRERFTQALTWVLIKGREQARDLIRRQTANFNRETVYNI